MASIFNKVNRLKSMPWTWDQFLTELDRVYPSGVDEKTLKKHYKQPHRASTQAIEQAIDSLHQRYFPSPFSRHSEALLRIYNRQQSRAERQDMQLLLHRLIDAEDWTETLDRVRLQWILANSYFDQIAELRDSRRQKMLAQCQSEAIRHYQAAIDMVITHPSTEQQLGANNLFKLRQNILACYLNALDKNQRDDAKLLTPYLQQADFFNSSRALLAAEPYQWSVARNALRFASILRDCDESEFFYHQLIKASPFFEDIHYQPLNTIALADSPVFNWAINQLKLATKQ
ncbi:hypothetical protein SIN8267_01943 [Sinobacterium norvegicum]|uniref:DUF4034 domain-containing protein n=1 Tax=Sinobacterium norvegicum TaxID=1641715 RepID=A0ABM9AF46_9GAMM|nr:hypothetical protein [Sinobacterium norvegicum]CAH0991828.1 hypothetical protein SIN8267_01943 [Sinobacterium norvegicum]